MHEPESRSATRSLVAALLTSRADHVPADRVGYRGRDPDDQGRRDVSACAVNREPADDQGDNHQRDDRRREREEAGERDRGLAHKDPQGNELHAEVDDPENKVATTKPSAFSEKRLSTAEEMSRPTAIPASDVPSLIPHLASTP